MSGSTNAQPERYVVFATATGIVSNVVLWNGDIATWQPPAGEAALLDAAGAYNIGSSVPTAAQSGAVA